jgi:hypothetical protein
VTIEPHHFAILIFVIAPAAVLGAAALNAFMHKGKDNEE